MNKLPLASLVPRLFPHPKPHGEREPGSEANCSLVHARALRPCRRVYVDLGGETTAITTVNHRHGPGISGSQFAVLPV